MFCVNSVCVSKDLLWWRWCLELSNSDQLHSLSMLSRIHRYTILDKPHELAKYNRNITSLSWSIPRESKSHVSSRKLRNLKHQASVLPKREQNHNVNHIIRTMSLDRESNDFDRPRRYENEDTTPTSDRELKGWYSYGLAAEVFAVCGVGAFTIIQSAIFMAIDDGV